MPVKYDIPSSCETTVPCNYCGGSGVQFIGAKLGYRGCQYCITGYKVRNCEYCNGQGCEHCVGHKHEFYTELSDGSSVSTPTSDRRPYAGEPKPASPRIVMSRR